jgi:hypothetical protein
LRLLLRRRLSGYISDHIEAQPDTSSILLSYPRFSGHIGVFPVSLPHLLLPGYIKVYVAISHMDVV